ncbi:MAG: YkgJ family cysteine cluster protein [Acidobacteriota bacterium]
MTIGFVHPPDVRFSCTRCGDCCRNAEILLTPEEADRLSTLDWRDRVARLVGAQVTVPVRTLAGRRRLAHQDGGACVFLDEQSQCLLHTHFGAEAKPALCRSYPFAFRALGERTAVDVSFACRSVSMGGGKPLAGRTAEWQALAPGASAAPMFLRAGIPISAETAWALEEHAISLLGDGTLTLPDRLRAVLQLTRLGTSGPADAPSLTTLWNALVRGIPAQVRREPCEATMDPTQASVFWQWLYLALNPASPGLATAPRALQDRAKKEIERAADRYRARSGQPHVDGSELGKTFEEIAAIDTSALQGAVAEPLAIYLRAKVLGQKLLKAGLDEMPIAEAIPKLLLAAPMTIWTAKALAAGRGAAAVGEADVRAALRLIDRTLGQIPTSLLPPRQAKAFDWVMLETDIVEAATNDMLRRGA